MSVDEEDEKEKGTRIVLTLVRTLQLVFLLTTYMLILIGPGFHIRQSWFVMQQSRSNGSTVQQRVECGFMAQVSKPEQSACLLETNPELPVDSLRGYYGIAEPSKWGDLSILGGQAFCTTMMTLMILLVLVLVGPLYARKPPPIPKQITVIALVVCVVVSFLIIAIQLSYFKCGGHVSTTLADFDKQIKDYISASGKEVVPTTDNNRIAICYVQGFAVAAFFALLNLLLFLFDALFVFKMQAAENRIKQVKR